MDWLGFSHLGAALLALASGAVVVFNTKGTRFHRWAGRLYAGTMLALNLSALAIYDLFGIFGPFHYAAVASLLTIIAGVVTARRRRAGWRVRHAYWMSWSYVGLIAAAVAESATRWLDYDFGWTVAVASLAVIAVGGVVMSYRLPGVLNPGLRS